MLAQHLVTKPVFEALFSGHSFATKNPISKAMQGVLDVAPGAPPREGSRHARSASTTP
jgi:predicted helicase